VYLGQISTRIVFDKDIGEFTLRDRGPGKPAYMIHEIKSLNGEGGNKLKFEGALTADVLQKQFIDWLAAAALERGAISQTDFENLHGGIKAVRGVPLRTSKLSEFALLATQESPHNRRDFTPN
jgi:hypothetical protein